MRKLCPIDGSLMQTIRYEESNIEICPNCSGVWCDKNELKEIVDSRIMKFNLDHPEQIVNERKVLSKDKIPDVYECCVCRQLLERLNYDYASGILIDRCRKGCGVWLDNGEIEKVQIYVEKWEKNLAQKDQRQSEALRKMASASAQFKRSK